MKTLTLLIILSVFMIAMPALGDYEITWSTINSGGGQSNGGDYVLVATVGQPEAGASSGGDYELLGGFLVGGSLCLVEFEDFARFAEYWMQTGTGLPADLYEDGVINTDDLLEFANYWLYVCPSDWPLK